MVTAAALVLLTGSLATWRSRNTGAARRDGRRNVLLVTIDTLRWDALGAYGQKRKTSPWIDRLASAGVRFETAHAHNTVTLPSHANILSGRYPFEHGVRDNAGFRFPREVETLATLLRDAGYPTGAFVSAFALDSRFGLDRGFTVYEDSFGDAADAGRFRLPERRAEDTVALARRWIDRQERPWFAWVHAYDPHAPYAPRAPFARAFGDAPYLGEVAATDAALGRLIAPLLDKGGSGRTLVVVTSDHGESLGEHGEATHGLFAYEATLRVPLVLFAPGLLRPGVVGHPVRHVDILPTVLDALDLPVPANLPGRSLLALAAGEDLEPEDAYFEALSGMLGRGWAPLYGIVRDGRKYIDLPLPELYDLTEDPGETKNGAVSEPRLRRELAAVLARLRACDTGVDRSEETAETMERLAALGYLTATMEPVREAYTEADDPKRLIHLDRLMQETIRRHRNGDFAGARETVLRVVRERPNMTAALMQLALLERKAGRLPAAITALEQAIAVSPDDLSTAVLLGSYLGEAGRAREAADLLTPFVGRADPPLDVLTTQGAALARLGRTAEAIATFERARRADPDNPMTLVQLATVHLGAGDGEAARARLEEALRINPTVALAHHHLGLLALARGDQPEAERRLRRALTLDPESADTLLHLGRLLVRSGRPAEARPLLERFVASAPAEIYAGPIRKVRAWLTSTRAT